MNRRGVRVEQALEARGVRIKQALEARGVRKQHALANSLRVHESAITRWKEGGDMSLDNAIALCRELDLSADWLLLGLGNMDQHRMREKPTSTYFELADLMTPKAMANLVVFVKALLED